MKNPWTTKNPFMSMWLSGANTIASSARGLAAAQVQRQATTLMTQGMQEMIRFWSGAALTNTPPARRKKRRR